MSKAPLIERSTQLLTLGALLGALLGTVTAAIGFRVNGPMDDILLLQGQVTALHSADSIARVERDRLRDEVAAIKAGNQLRDYMLCIITRRVAPDAVPSECARKGP